MNDDYTADIPYDLARLAHAGTSHAPEKRAEEEIATYAENLRKDYEVLSQLAITESGRAALDGEFARYRAGFRRLYLAYLQSRARCLSILVAGPANFPGRRNDKRTAIADRRYSDLVDFRDRALRAIRRVIAPELGPILAGDADAAERLREKIRLAEIHQERMKAVNRAYDRWKKDPSTLDRSDLSTVEKACVRMWKPQYTFERHPHAPFELQNNNANLRRLKQRLAEIEVNKATPSSSIQGPAARLEDAPADNRVRLVFPGKPDDTVRDTLKRGGFRWTPSLNCWQAYRNPNTARIARQIAGIDPSTS